MQYDVKTPSEYIDKLDNNWRLETLEALRALIKSKAPNMVESINYKMLSYGDANGIAFHLNAQKNYVSLYVGNSHKIDPDGELLQGLNIGKGCIRFKKSVAVSNTRIAEFIERAVILWNQRADIEC